MLDTSHHIRRCFVGLAMLFIVMTVWNLTTGEVSLLNSLWTMPHHLDAYQKIALYDFRMPRWAMAGLCGALFAASGTILQTVMRNALAAPDIVGVTAGAAIMAVLGLIVFPSLSNIEVAWLSSAGAFGGFALTYFLARIHGQVSPTRLALTGVAIGASLLAGEHFLLLIAPIDIGPSLSFIAGTVYGVDWSRVKALWPWALLLLSLALCLGRSLDLLALPDETAIGIGFPVKRMRGLSLLVAVLLAGLGVAGAGILGFVGLLAPQIARVLVGAKHQVRLPMAMLVGAVLVIAADTLGRVIAPPMELPAGIVTTIIGVPYFLWLLIRGRHCGNY
jgi:iron complex transport system permease protein